jgi:hypothetical protein
LSYENISKLANSSKIFDIATSPRIRGFMNRLIILPCLLTFIACSKDEPSSVNNVHHPERTALQNPCITNLKNRMINRSIELGDEKTLFDDQAVKYFSSLNSLAIEDRNFEFSKGEENQNHYDKIGVTFQYEEGRELEYSLSLNEEKLELELDFSVKHDGIDFSIEKSFSVNENCELSFKDLEILTEEETTPTDEKLTKFYYNLMDEAFEDTKIVRKDNLDLDIEPRELFKELKDKKIFQQMGFIHFDFDNSGVQTKSEISLLDQSIQYNPISKAEENFSHAIWRMETSLLGNLEIALSADLRNEYYVMSAEAFSLYSEYCSCEGYFLDSRLSSNLENKVKVTGLTKDDFHNFKTSIRVTTDYFENIELLKTYFNVKELTENGYTLALKKPTIETSKYPSIILDNDQVYLEASKFIEINHPKIVEFKNEILAKNVSTRADVLREVLKIVNREIVYDHDQVNNDVTRALSLDEIFNKKEGVCQHYALIATSLLRSLGIPSRIASGFSLDEEGAGGHAWIEVKLNNKTWTPIEPQLDDSYYIWTFNYFPLGEMSNYEEGNRLFEKNFVESGSLGFIKNYLFEKINQ